MCNEKQPVQSCRPYRLARVLHSSALDPSTAVPRNSMIARQAAGGYAARHAGHAAYRWAARKQLRPPMQQHVDEQLRANAQIGELLSLCG